MVERVPLLGAVEEDGVDAGVSMRMKGGIVRHGALPRDSES
jgi:hypothetical protein